MMYVHTSVCIMHVLYILNIFKILQTKSTHFHLAKIGVHGLQQSTNEEVLVPLFAFLLNINLIRLI